MDDILIIENSEFLLKELIANLGKLFAMKDLGNLHYFLGLESDFTASGLHLTQSNYELDLLQRTKMENAKPYHSPATSVQVPLHHAHSPPRLAAHELLFSTSGLDSGAQVTSPSPTQLTVTHSSSQPVHSSPAAAPLPPVLAVDQPSGLLPTAVASLPPTAAAPLPLAIAVDQPSHMAGSAGGLGNMNGEVTSLISPLMEKVLIDEKDREQLIESNKLADVCSQIQNSNKKGNGSRMDENLAIKSVYSKLRNDKGNMRPLDSRCGRGENLEQVDNEESGLKVDGPGRTLVERASTKSERPTQSFKMKAQDGRMADFDPARTKYIFEVCKTRRSFDKAEEGFDEDNEDGVVRDGIGSEDGKKKHDQPIKRIGRKKNHFVKSHDMLTSHSKATALDLNQDFGKENIVPEVMKASWNLKEEITKVIKAGRVLGFDFNGREKDMVEEIVRKVKVGTFGKLEGILACNNN
ncbi:hypothetical protein LWI29_001091 [Acer saccharum]|uniref:Reverse transcriptase Ty1/copia-type domain-containing protein n=1 Tax=Acer saccharum TaxID=4024 RepID=A0AA39RSF5_ACESA|nr:hypothetical protein LWI29_001091 [Acer saccharum]